MTRRRKTKLVHEGSHVAEVDLELCDDETGWSRHLSMADAFKLDDVRDALRRRDLAGAATFGRIYELRPVAQQ